MTTRYYHQFFQDHLLVVLLNLIFFYKYYDQPADVVHLNYQLHLKLKLLKKKKYTHIHFN